MSLRDSQIAQKRSHGKHGNHGNVSLNTNCRYDNTQSTQMGADCAEKKSHGNHGKHGNVFLNTYHTNQANLSRQNQETL